MLGATCLRYRRRQLLQKSLVLHSRTLLEGSWSCAAGWCRCQVVGQGRAQRHLPSRTQALLRAPSARALNESPYSPFHGTAAPMRWALQGVTRAVSQLLESYSAAAWVGVRSLRHSAGAADVAGVQAWWALGWRGHARASGAQVLLAGSNQGTSDNPPPRVWQTRKGRRHWRRRHRSDKPL